ncbi:MAG: nitroreductase family protein [Thermoguttaceae bacterium]|jgi:hypothetical protein|nr:nitroreductase family protein [Thermoguttaceae bacterium]MBR5759087.1 nitroreductase family protein [Thermoguttaceae bacterium]
MNRREAIVGATCGVLGLVVTDAARSEEGKDDLIKRLTEVRSATKFSDEPVDENDLKNILQIGANSPSALNRQPWFFAAVTDRQLLAEIDRAAEIKAGRLSLTGSPTVIFVCGDDTDYARFDVGAACDRMAVTAILLGYGTKTVASPCPKTNEKFKERLGIPEKYNAYAALLIGREETPSVDGVSGATSRVPLEEKISRVK